MVQSSYPQCDCQAIFLLGQKDAPRELEQRVLERNFVWCLMFRLHTDSSQEQSRASCLGWGCWGLPGFFPVAHAFIFNLCLLQNHDVVCFQHGGLLNSTSTEALHPVTLLSWTFLCITGYRHPPWCLPTHQMPVMHTYSAVINSFRLYLSSCGSQNHWGHSASMSSCGFIC